MPDRQPDSRSLIFAADVDGQEQPLPMTPDVLRARTEKWPVSEYTPDDVAALLARSRQMFGDGYYTYENFIRTSHLLVAEIYRPGNLRSGRCALSRSLARGRGARQMPPLCHSAAPNATPMPL
jgi:hypothetical protein